MIDFKKELEKYKPILEVDDVEEAIYEEEMQDLLEILQNINKKIKK